MNDLQEKRLSKRIYYYEGHETPIEDVPAGKYGGTLLIEDVPTLEDLFNYMQGTPLSVSIRIGDLGTITSGQTVVVEFLRLFSFYFGQTLTDYIVSHLDCSAESADRIKQELADLAISSHSHRKGDES